MGGEHQGAGFQVVEDEFDYSTEPKPLRDGTSGACVPWWRGFCGAPARSV